MRSFIKKIKTKYILEADPKTFEKDLRTIGYTAKDGCVTAMAFEKRDAIKKLKNLALPITEHLMKILVMPKSSDTPHWKAELKTWQTTLRRYNNGKSKSGINYSLDVLMMHLWENPLGTSADQKTVLQILAEAGYDVPRILTSDQTNKLKKAVNDFSVGILKSSF